MSRHAFAAWIAPPLLALLAVPTVVGLAAGVPAAHIPGPAGVSWSDPAGIGPCPEAGPAETAPGAAQTSRGAAWRLAPVLAADGGLAGWNLVTAAQGTRAGALRLPAEAAVRGPVDGLVAVAGDDGERSEISLVSPVRACAVVIHRDRDVVRQAVLEPRTGAILFHAVRRADRADLGVRRLRPGVAETPAQVLAPLAAADPFLAEVGRIWSTQLQVAHGGRHLAVQSCGAHDCRTRVVDLATGRVRRTMRADEGTLVGLDGTTAVSFQACAGLPCPLVATDLESGRQRLLSEAAVSATTLVVDRRLVVVAVLQEREAGELVAIDPVDGSRRSLAGAAASLRLLPAGGSAVAGTESSTGWIAAADERDGVPFGIDVARLLAAAPEVSR